MQPFASRIRIMGSPGSGKTTISRALADATGLPLLALDRDLWIPAKSQKDTQQRNRRLSAAVDEFLAAHDQWIIEGNHLDWTRQTVEQATYQVVLSRPLAVRIWRCFRRWQGNPDQRRSLRSHLGQQRYTAVYNFTSLPS
ncbi:MAG: AAA family ATPase, partial [Dehalococcoidia bacterium]